MYVLSRVVVREQLIRQAQPYTYTDIVYIILGTRGLGGGGVGVDMDEVYIRSLTPVTTTVNI